MAIEVTCPQGHRLRVKESFAGKKGLCPVCKTPVLVPKPEKNAVSEDDILNFIGPSTSGVLGRALTPEEIQELEQAGSQIGHSNNHTPHKVCSKCNQEISSASHICPFCHTYIAELADFKIK
jgi:hypothetical protein